MRVAAVHFIPMAFKYTMLYNRERGWGGDGNKIIYNFYKSHET